MRLLCVDSTVVVVVPGRFDVHSPLNAGARVTMRHTGAEKCAEKHLCIVVEESPGRFEAGG